LVMTTTGANGNALERGIEISIGIDDNGIFAAHLQDRALDPDLSGSAVGGNLVDAQSYFTRSGEGDETRFRMGHNQITKASSGAGAEVHDAFGHPGFFQYFYE